MNPTFKDVEETVCWVFNVSPIDLHGKRGKPRTALARATAFAILYDLTGLTSTQIGKLYGKTHGCVVKAWPRIRLLFNDKESQDWRLVRSAYKLVIENNNKTMKTNKNMEGLK